MRIVSLFSGYGGLELGVQAVVGGEVIAHVEFDDAPSRILAHRFPGVPNLGDITQVDWQKFIVDHPELAPLCGTYRPGLVLTGGFPCQDVSLAGLRRGLKDGTRSGLWAEFARAIDALRPELVVIENVRGLLSAEATGVMEPDPWDLGDRSARPTLRAHGAVLGDLADIGYDTRWCGVRAADAGAPHGRFRVFVLAYPEGDAGWLGDGDGEVAPDTGGEVVGLGTGLRSGDASGDGRRRPAHDSVPDPAADAARVGRGEGWPEPAGRGGGSETEFGCAPADAGGERFGEHAGEPSAEEARTASGDLADGPGGLRPDRNWGPYRLAIRRWESATGRVAPSPTEPTGKADSHRLSPRFVEWMMGLPAGWLTEPAIGLTRNQQLKALGNGVVPQQAALAVRTLLQAEEMAA